MPQVSAGARSHKVNKKGSSASFEAGNRPADGCRSNMVISGSHICYQRRLLLKGAPRPCLFVSLVDGLGLLDLLDILNLERESKYA